jgi:gamma-glutamyltranspeptidase
MNHQITELSILIEYNFSRLDQPIFYHRLVEAFKHAFAKRSYLGDIDFVEINAVSLNFIIFWKLVDGCSLVDE